MGKTKVKKEKAVKTKKPVKAAKVELPKVSKMQQHYLDSHFKRQSVEDLAKETGLSVEVVQKYLEDMQAQSIGVSKDVQATIMTAAMSKQGDKFNETFEAPAYTRGPDVSRIR